MSTSEHMDQGLPFEPPTDLSASDIQFADQFLKTFGSHGVRSDSPIGEQKPFFESFESSNIQSSTFENVFTGKSLTLLYQSVIKCHVTVLH